MTTLTSRIILGKIRLPYKIVLKWILITVFFLIFAVLSRTRFKDHVCKEVSRYPHENQSTYAKFCSEINHRIANENFSNDTIQLNDHEPIPYWYSRWQSNPIMPRLLTPCEHGMYMYLLSLLIDRVFSKYNIPYMMKAATLLGSYTRHDILPWDDDVDLRVSISDREKLNWVVVKELVSEPYHVVIARVANHRNYDKIFFSWGPRAGPKWWRFPFVDIFYHDQNSTHIWLLGTPKDCPTKLADVFPLVLRPLGSLWLYSPREPMAHFDSRNMKHIEDGCFASVYSHKEEKVIRSRGRSLHCSRLKSIYPYVDRRCTEHNCIEYLRLGNSDIIQTVVYKHAYRTKSIVHENNKQRVC